MNILNFLRAPFYKKPLSDYFLKSITKQYYTFPSLLRPGDSLLLHLILEY